MKNKILILGSIIFVSSVAWGETLRTLPQASEIVSQAPVPFEHHIASSLISRGLEEEAAKAFSQNCVDDVYSATLLTHILSTKLSIATADIYDYIASQTLFNKSVDLRDYADVVSLVQNVKGIGKQKEDLKAIKEYTEIV